ncbi:quinoprotein relay system zinc metallohydrolase 1 [Neptunomonas japonica]|uniref:Beta-lactamase domain-containing protein n=1 Tax=Neptunomonas japonica JAMM 1380 TaxID=1441457 RepID=A0A7R6PGV8_9GAMM|nr:quinoprotein relay system zinc metallohydrolase 1 [Neptunomonas japonica]BBB28046.1 beta-lactamase domain-containing protein [Neptunomonas japonica JAMM 1380]
MKQLQYLLFSLLMSLSCSVFAAKLSYSLEPQKIADDTWLLQGKLEDFTRKNGGNIVNTAFIVTEEGVVVFDTGPSKRYGEAMRQAIDSVTDKAIIHVFNSHHHPDHFLGNQAFSDSKIWALPETGKLIAQQGNAFAENMYRLVGDWMRSTEVQLPTEPLDLAATPLMDVGKHRFRFIQMKGHSGADLLMLDETTGVLFASDIVFFKRALTTPHTPSLSAWIENLEQLKNWQYHTLVPGHGPIDTTGLAVEQMADYLRWLDKTLTAAASQGLSMNEVMELPIDARFSDISLTRLEFVRSVFHLYSRYEEASF